MNEQEYQQMLIQAIRDRILNDVRSPREIERVVNNVYGGPLTSDKNQGLGAGVRGEMSPEELEYIVNIERKDLPEINPLTGKPVGWSKTVTRKAQKRGQDPTPEDPEELKKKT